MRDSGLFDLINEALVVAARLISGRVAEPTAGIIDSQSVKTTESGGPCGYDAGKKIKGRKRHILTDTQGNLLALITHTFADDRARNRKDNGPKNLAILRKLTVNLPRTTRPKLLISRKRKRSGWSDAFARSVIAQMR